MGMCDLIPGVSGGTLAFTMGFYQSLLTGLKSLDTIAFKLLVTGKWRAFAAKVPLKFLTALFSGALFSIFLMASPIHYLLSHPLYRSYLYALFLGLVLFASFFSFFKVARWSLQSYLAASLGCLVALAFTLFSFSHSGAKSGPYAIKVDPTLVVKVADNYLPSKHLVTQLSQKELQVYASKGAIEPQTMIYSNKGEQLGILSQIIENKKGFRVDFWLILCGLVAICAMLLPGISGSYLLTLMGAYTVVIGALADWTAALKKGRFDLDSFMILTCLGLGIILGVALFSRFINWLLRHYPNSSLAALSGFMTGALPSLWPFWSYQTLLDVAKLQKGAQLALLHPILPSLSALPTWIATLFFIAGFSLLFAIEKLANPKKLVYKKV